MMGTEGEMGGRRRKTHVVGKEAASRSVAVRVERSLMTDERRERDGGIVEIAVVGGNVTNEGGSPGWEARSLVVVDIMDVEVELEDARGSSSTEAELVMVGVISVVVMTVQAVKEGAGLTTEVAVAWSAAILTFELTEELRTEQLVT